MNAKKHLIELHKEFHRKKYPAFPYEYWDKLIIRYPDTTEKGLKKCIESFCEFTGNFAESINNRGFRIDNRKIVTNVIGQMKVIGSVEWRKSSQTKGTADMQVRIKRPDLPFAIPIAVEIKIGRDYQRPAQKKYQQEVEQAGGLYWIVTSFEDFYQKYLQLMKNV